MTSSKGNIYKRFFQNPPPDVETGGYRPMAANPRLIINESYGFVGGFVDGFADGFLGGGGGKSEEECRVAVGEEAE